jgi:hypothetical protein
MIEESYVHVLCVKDRFKGSHSYFLSAMALALYCADRLFVSVALGRVRALAPHEYTAPARTLFIRIGFTGLLAPDRK